MRAGRLDKQIAIEQPGESLTAGGQSKPTWSAFAAEVWAEEVPLSAKETTLGPAAVASQQTRWRIRFIPGVTARMRVVYGSRVCPISQVINVDGRSRELLLVTSEIV